MSSIDDVRSELASRLEAVQVPGSGTLRTSKWFLDAVSPPMAVIGEDDPFINPLQVLETTEAELNFRVIVYASRVQEKAGQSLLDGFRASSGTGSVTAALTGSWSASDPGHYSVVTSVGPTQVYTVGQIEYLGCEFAVTVVSDI